MNTGKNEREAELNTIIDRGKEMLKNRPPLAPFPVSEDEKKIYKNMNAAQKELKALERARGNEQQTSQLDESVEPQQTEQNMTESKPANTTAQKSTINSLIDTYYDNDTNSGGLTEAAVPREELAEQVGNLKSELTDATLGKGNYEDSWNAALDIAKKIVNNSYVNHDEFAAEYQAAKKYIRRHRMYVQPEAKSGELGESFAQFRKNNFGGLLLTSNPADSKILDVYTDMQNDFPQFFPNADSDMKRGGCIIQ